MLKLNGVVFVDLEFLLFQKVDLIDESVDNLIVVLDLNFVVLFQFELLGFMMWDLAQLGRDCGFEAGDLFVEFSGFGLFVEMKGLELVAWEDFAFL